MSNETDRALSVYFFNRALVFCAVLILKHVPTRPSFNFSWSSAYIFLFVMKRHCN